MLPSGQRGFDSHYLPPPDSTKGKKVPVSVMYVLYVSTCVLSVLYVLYVSTCVYVLYVYACVYVLYVYMCVNVPPTPHPKALVHAVSSL